MDSTESDCTQSDIDELKTESADPKAPLIHPNDMAVKSTEIDTVSDEMQHCNLAWVKLIESAGESIDPERQLMAVREVGDLIVRRPSDETIDPLIANGTLPILVKCLEYKGNRPLQLEATRALVGITGGTPTHANQVVQANAVPLLIDLLNSTSELLCSRAVGALANIVIARPNLRDYVIQKGFIEPLLGLTKSDRNHFFLSDITFAISNLFYFQKLSISIDAATEILPALNDLLDVTHTGVLKDVLEALRRLANGKERIHFVIESGVVPKVIQLLGNEHVKLAALCVIGKISCGSEEQLQVLLSHNALSYISAMLSDANPVEVLNFLANVTASNQSHIQAVIDAGLLPKIIEILGQEHLEVQQEAVAVICNVATVGSSMQNVQLSNGKAIPALCNLLTCENTKVVFAALNAIDKILKRCEAAGVIKQIHQCYGLMKIEQLRRRIETHKNDNKEIYNLAHGILKQFFSGDED